jgi:hypothetical protein
MAVSWGLAVENLRRMWHPHTLADAQPEGGDATTLCERVRLLELQLGGVAVLLFLRTAHLFAAGNAR